MKINCFILLFFVGFGLTQSCTYPCADSQIECGISSTCWTTTCSCNTVTFDKCLSCLGTCDGVTEHNINCATIVGSREGGTCNCYNFIATCRCNTDNELDKGGICKIGNGPIIILVLLAVGCICFYVLGFVGLFIWKRKRATYSPVD